MASSAPARAPREWVLWRPASPRVSVLPVAPVLVIVGLYQLATSDGGQHLDSLAWVQTIALVLLAALAWVGAIRRTAVSGPLVAMIFGIALSTAVSVRPEVSVREFLLWLTYLSIFLLTGLMLAGPEAARKFVDAAVALGGWLCLIALFLFWGAGNSTMRWYSTFYWPNPFAAFLLLLVPVGLVRFVHARGVRESIAHGAITVLLGTALVLTYSRGAWVSLALTLPAAFLVLRPASWSTSVRRVVFLGVVVALSVALLTRGAVLRGSLRGVAGPTVARAVLDDTSIQGRLNFWRSGLRIFEDHPLFGTGAGTFGTVHPLYQRDVRFYAKDAHNLYVQTAAEMGIIGVFVLAGLLGSIGALWIRALRMTRGRGEYPVVVGIGLGLLAFMIHSAVDMNWSYPANAAMAFALLGVLAAYDRPIQMPDRFRQRSKQTTAWRYLAVLVLLGAAVTVQAFYKAERQYLEGQRLAQAGVWRDAAERYAQAARWNPLGAKYFATYGYAATQVVPPRFDVARTAIRRAMLLDRSNAAYPIQFARLHIAQGVDSVHGAEAEALLHEALSLDRLNRPDAYRLLADLYVREGRTDDAERVYRDAMALYRGHDLGRGSIIYIRLWPEVTNLFMDAAELAVRRGDRPRAAKILRDLLAEDPDAVQAALRLSQIYLALGQSANARAVLEVTATRIPDNAEIRAALKGLP